MLNAQDHTGQELMDMTHLCLRQRGFQLVGDPKRGKLRTYTSQSKPGFVIDVTEEGIYLIAKLQAFTPMHDYESIQTVLNNVVLYNLLPT